MAQLSRGILKRRKLVADVRTANQTFLERGAEGFHETFLPVLGEGEAPPEIRGILERASELLDTSLVRLTAADVAAQVERSGDADLLKRRQELASALSQRFQRVRSICLGEYSETVVRRLAFDDRVSQDPEGLLQQVDLVLEHSKAPDLDPGPSLTGRDLTAKGLAALFEPARGELAGVLEEIRSARRRASLAAVNRREALQEHDKTFGRVVRWLVATYRLADELELADRIQSNLRRLRSRSPVDEVVEDPLPQPPPGQEPAPADPQPSPDLPLPPDEDPVDLPARMMRPSGRPEGYASALRAPTFPGNSSSREPPVASGSPRRPGEPRRPGGPIAPGDAGSRKRSPALTFGRSTGYPRSAPHLLNRPSGSPSPRPDDCHLSGSSVTESRRIP